MIDSHVRGNLILKKLSDRMVFIEKVEKKVQVGKHSIFALKKCSLSLGQVKR